jgi:hypothetical protein
VFTLTGAGSSSIVAGSPVCTITALSNGWYRCAAVVTATSAQTSAFRFQMYLAGTSYAGDGTSGLYLYGAQLAPSGSLDAYSATVAAAPSSAAYYGPAFDYDPSALTARGLRIEEARTNLTPGLLSSSTYWTPLSGVITQGVTAPDGTATGFTITANAGGVTSYGANLQAASIPTITAGPMTASIFVKSGSGGWFRLILADATTPTIGVQCYFNTATGALGTVGTQAGAPSAVSATVQTISNGWYRISLTGTLGAATTATMLLRLVSANGVTTDVGSSVVLAFNPQLEAGSLSTSPILTTTATVARAADTATINPLGSWFNSAEGTLFVESQRPLAVPSGLFPRPLSFSNGTNSNLLEFSYSASEQFAITDATVVQATIVLGDSGTATFRLAGAYKLNDIAASRNGGAVGTDVAATIPTVDRLHFGNRWDGARTLNGYVRKVKVSRARKSNADLQTVTT